MPSLMGESLWTPRLAGYMLGEVGRGCPRAIETWVQEWRQRAGKQTLGYGRRHARVALHDSSKVAKMRWSCQLCEEGLTER